MCHLHDHAATLPPPPLSLFISEAGEMEEKKLRKRNQKDRTFLCKNSCFPLQMRTEDNARVPSSLTLAAAQYSISWQVARSRATDFGLLPLLSSFSSAGAKGRKGKERNRGPYIARAHPESLLPPVSSYWTAGRDGGGGREGNFHRENWYF